MFDNQTMATVSGCSKLPVFSNGPVDSTDDELETVKLTIATAEER